MSSLIAKNYKIIISVVLVILCLPILPIIMEIIFKLGQMVGTAARMFGNSGMCF